jgi:small conductance mechanosensitive channel
VLVIALVGTHLASAALRRLEKKMEDGDPHHLSEREKRARTLTSILRKLIKATVFAVAGLVILNELGVNIGPLLAAAGIGGLAVGFGAQNLVRDVISGFFMLMENQIRVGDMVTLHAGGSQFSGQVEDVTLRTTVLRDLEGVVHIVPNGAIQVVSNRTREWSRAVLDIGVAYHEDVDRVIGILQEVGAELAADPEFGPLILEPPEVLGVDAFGASEVTVKLTVTTRPLKQLLVARELRRRIKKRFDAEGVEIPFPHVTLYWGTHSRPLELRQAIQGKE